MTSRKPSEIIKDFLDLMDSSHDQYLNSKKTVESYDEQTISWVHKIENEQKSGVKFLLPGIKRDLLEEQRKITCFCMKKSMSFLLMR